ncbi:unnamed protein product [Arabis nemorensis]|uniref:Rho termination factor-like N-terminal domain-containing protein n=1 Tax=Arabis nemorensis TaxID=586526 RepID=A0A565BPA5_9BRAS|nr:unnamed protein product [Arabis nemorensis]
MDDDDDLWGPPFGTLFGPILSALYKTILFASKPFYEVVNFDVLEENFQNERYCELVWRILNEKKQIVEIDELDKDMASSGTGDSRDIGSSDSDKTRSAVLPDADTSSGKSALDEDENTSGISDAQTIETRDSSTDIEEIDSETRLKPQETAANDPPTVEVAEDADTSSSPVLANKIDEAEEHSCSSLVTDQVFDPIKLAPENKSSSPISRENIGGSTVRPLALETREKANATNEDGETLKDHQQSNSFQDVITVSEPFTTESLLEMCDEPDKGRESPCDKRSKRSHPEAVKTVVKDELIINLLNETRKKAENKALLNPGSVLIKKRESKSNSSDNKGVKTGFIRTTKQKLEGEAGEINIVPVKKSTQSTPKIIRGGSNVPTQHTDSMLDSIDRVIERGGETMSDSVISISDLKNKTGKELRSIGKELKVTHYYKLKKEELLQQIIMQLTECTKQRMET